MRALRSSALVVGSSLAIASGALAQNAVQWRVEDGGNGHWYQWKAWGSVQSWASAVSASSALGGHLATLTSAQEESFVRLQAPPGSCGSAATSEALIGLIQSKNAVEPSGGWSWMTGEELGYANWRFGEPNNEGDVEDVGFLNMASGWNDGRLVSFGCANAAIIEWSADCNSDGIVDYGQILAGELVDTNGNNIPDCCEQGVDCRFTAVQWRVEDGGNGHWYKRTESWRTWDEAKNEAETVGGTLVTINSQAEGAYLAQHVAPSLNFWAGGRRVKGVWQWITGEPWDYTAWNCNHCHPSCQPDYPWEDHLEAMCFDGSTLRWNNYTSGNGRPAYVVEWSADCNSDGIVDYGQIRSGELADANGNYIPDCCEATPPCGPCLADVDGSGAVNGVDLAAILNTWGTSGGKYPGADVNSDGIVNGADLAEVLNSWGPCP